MPHSPQSITQRATEIAHTLPLRHTILFTPHNDGEHPPVFIAPNNQENRHTLFAHYPPGSHLNPSEINRANTLLRQHQREHWIFSRLLLKTCIAHILERAIADIHLQFSPLGKPHLPHLAFSLSHCPQHTALTFSSTLQSLGIDIEPTCSSATAQAIRPFLHPAEQKQLTLFTSEEAPAQVTRFWVRKEAFLKALGTGLLREPSRDFLGNIHEPTLPRNLKTGTLKHFSHPTLSNHQIALCALPANDLHDDHLEFKNKTL